MGQLTQHVLCRPRSFKSLLQLLCDTNTKKNIYRFANFSSLNRVNSSDSCRHRSCTMGILAMLSGAKYPRFLQLVYHSKESISTRAVLVPNKTHTNILATRWRCINAVCASLHAIVQGQAVVVSTYYRTTKLLDGSDGRLGRARRRYVYRYFEMFYTLEAASITSVYEFEKGKTGSCRTSPSSLTPSWALCIHPLNTSSLAVMGFSGDDVSRPCSIQWAIRSRLTGA